LQIICCKRTDNDSVLKLSCLLPGFMPGFFFERQAGDGGVLPGGGKEVADAGCANAAAVNAKARFIAKQTFAASPNL
jgi:hypothetical protein